MTTPKQPYPTIDEQLEKVLREAVNYNLGERKSEVDFQPLYKYAKSRLRSLISRYGATQYNEGFHKAKSEKKVKE